MSISAKSAEQIIQLLKAKVQAGTLDKETAEHLAVLAVQEVRPEEQTAAEEAPVEEAPVEDAPAPLPPGPAPSLDPTSDIMKLIADFDSSVGPAWTKLQAGIDELLKGVEGAAFPVGDFSSKSTTVDKGNSTKLAIKKLVGKANAADLAFSFDRSWELDGVKMPATVQAEVEPACHLGLRKELLALTQDVIDMTESELSWKRARVPEKTVSFLTKESAKENDKRVFDIMKDCPNDRELAGWRKWSVAAQVYLLGSDYSDTKSFEAIKASVKE